MPKQHAVTTTAGSKLAAVANLAPALENPKVTRGVTLDDRIARARSNWAKMRDSDKENALRGLLLGALFVQIKAQADRNFLQLAKTQMPEIPQPRRNELMRLWKEFTDETGVALPAEMDIPDAQLALQLGDGEAQNEVVSAAVGFVGDLSLYELMVKWEVREKKKLGGARTKGAVRDAQIDAEQLRILKRDEASEVLARARALYVEENLFQHLSVEESRAVLAGLEALVTEVRDALRPVFKAAAGKTQATS